MRPMSSDTKAVAPAMWEVYRCDRCGEGEACGFNDLSYDRSRDECHHPFCLEEAQDIVRAMNAGIIMQWRCWGVVRSLRRDKEEWQVIHADGRCLFDTRHGCGGYFIANHPFQAVVEANEWWKANVDPQPTASSPQPSPAAS